MTLNKEFASNVIDATHRFAVQAAYGPGQYDRITRDVNAVNARIDYIINLIERRKKEKSCEK